ncbi:MAG TPA: methylmalonyl Co-A mutase-associated GTPase MeaB [Cyclobacteriaceae bacterium]
MKVRKKPRLSVKDYTQGILAGNRVLLSRAITLVESSLSSDRKIAGEIIERLLPKTGKSIRVGITGVPGVGKSTFIETLGKMLTAQGKKVAVLAIDPSSQKTKGSILGDKTRMDELAKDPMAFIRPSSTNQSLGGVAESTRETILLCEAAGYQVILVETVGVGQSETTVRSMTDFFLLLMLPGSGDELQGIKKGIMEMADGIAITKSDNDNIKKAKQAQADFQHALHLFSAPESGITPKVLLTSSIEDKGINEVWKTIESYKEKTSESGFFIYQRQEQDVSWFRSQSNTQIRQKITQQKRIKTKIGTLEKKIRALKISPGKAVWTLLKDIKILIVLFLLCLQTAFSQNLAPQTRKMPNTSDLFNGMSFVRPESQLIGDVYIDSTWSLTSIELSEVEKPLEWYLTRYNLQEDELEIKTPTGTKELKWNRIKQFQVKDSTTKMQRRFIRGSNFKKDGVPLHSFMELLVDGARLLLKEYYLIFKNPDYIPALNAGSRDTQIIKNTNYYFSINGELQKIPGSKKFIASLGNQANEVGGFIKTNNLSLKNERDMIRIFQFYNSLLQP